MVITLGCVVMLPALLAMSNPLGVEIAVVNILNSAGITNINLGDNRKLRCNNCRSINGNYFIWISDSNRKCTDSTK